MGSALSEPSSEMAVLKANNPQMNQAACICKRIRHVWNVLLWEPGAFVVHVCLVALEAEDLDPLRRTDSCSDRFLLAMSSMRGTMQQEPDGQGFLE